jgi:hypothetical protein
VILATVNSVWHAVTMDIAQNGNILTVEYTNRVLTVERCNNHAKYNLDGQPCEMPGSWIW